MQKSVSRRKQRARRRLGEEQKKLKTLQKMGMGWSPIRSCPAMKIAGVWPGGRRLERALGQIAVKLDLCKLLPRRE